MVFNAIDSLNLADGVLDINSNTSEPRHSPRLEDVAGLVVQGDDCLLHGLSPVLYLFLLMGCPLLVVSCAIPIHMDTGVSTKSYHRLWFAVIYVVCLYIVWFCAFTFTS